MLRPVLFFLLLPFTLPAQQDITGTISGRIINDKQEAIPFANVLLKNSTDSSLYKGEISSDEGRFLFENVKAGSYLLEVRSIGYASFTRNDIRIDAENKTQDAGSITLSPVNQAVGEVVVQGDKPFIERQVDRTVVNVENSIIHTNSTVLEVMEKLPGIIVTQEGNISLKGKQGVIILIDGKNTGLSGRDLSNLLRGMPSSNIQKIEIITNPSARYDAAGNAGIINIVMKKNRQEGYNGSVNAGYGQGRYAKFNTGFNFSYRRNNFNYYVSYAYVQRNGFNNLVIHRNFFDAGGALRETFETNNYMLYPVQNHAPRMGVDFNLSKKTSLSVLATGSASSYNSTSRNHTDVVDANGITQSNYDFSNNSDNRWLNYSGSIQLLHKIDTSGQELTVNLDAAKYDNSTNDNFSTRRFDAQNQFIGETLILGKQDGVLQLFAGKTDYVKPLKNAANFEAGLKSSYVEADNNVLFFNNINGSLFLDSTISNHFIYSENINAAYLNYKKEQNKWTYQLGLRTEQTRAKGNQLITGQTFDRNYIQVFPTAFLDYKVNDNHGLNINVGRRIDRPGYDDLNPFRELIDATTYAEGNPFLKPQLTYNTELTYTYKQSFFATLSYSLTSDNITRALLQDNVSQLTVQTVVNLDQFNYFSLNLNFSKKLTKWWTTNTSLLSYYGIYTGTIRDVAIDRGIPSFYLNTSNSFVLSKTVSMEGSFFYSYKAVDGITIILPYHGLTIGAQFAVLKKKGTITTSVSDVFWRSYPSGVTQFNNVDEYWTSYRDSRVANVAFTYRFGKGQAGRIRRTTGADEEKGRVGNG